MLISTPCAAEAIMKTAPGQGRDCQQNQGGQRHYQAQATQRNRSDHDQLNRGKNGKPQRPQWSGMNLFSLRDVRMPGQFGATLCDKSDNHHCKRRNKENDECRHDVQRSATDVVVQQRRH